MMLNEKKTNCMIFNFTNNYQFNTRLYIEGENIKENQKLNYQEQLFQMGGQYKRD